ncbi:MAG TPA: hypothetical protein VN132_07465 [Bdellovibrio sp.]|nr:hypothetical protein [Bdellovibrio sp.]
MKLITILLSIVSLSYSAQASYNLNNCKNADGSLSPYSFSLSFGLDKFTSITFKDGAKTYKGAGTTEEYYTMDSNYNDELDFHGSVKSADPLVRALGLHIYTAKQQNGQAKVLMFKYDSKTLFCTQTDTKD